MSERAPKYTVIACALIDGFGVGLINRVIQFSRRWMSGVTYATNERHREGSHAKHKDDGTSIRGDHATPHAPRARWSDKLA